MRADIKRSSRQGDIPRPQGRAKGAAALSEGRERSSLRGEVPRPQGRRPKRAAAPSGRGERSSLRGDPP